MQSGSSQHASDMQTGSSQHISESASSSHNPDRPLRATNRQSPYPGLVPESPFRPFANSPLGAVRGSPPEASSSSPSRFSQADASVSVKVRRSFLSAAKHGRTSSPQMQRSPLAGKGSSPGMSMAYSASSEDGASTSGMILCLG